MFYSVAATGAIFVLFFLRYKSGWKIIQLTPCIIVHDFLVSDRVSHCQYKTILRLDNEWYVYLTKYWSFLDLWLGFLSGMYAKIFAVVEYHVTSIASSPGKYFLYSFHSFHFLWLLFFTVCMMYLKKADHPYKRNVKNVSSGLRQVRKSNW